MAKKFFPRALSVGLSLALCAGMVLPSFAAQVLNNENKDQFIDQSGALLGHDGNGGRGDQYDYELGENLELEKTLVIQDGADASIDLKGNDLVHTGKTGSVISIKDGGKLELDDTTAETSEDGSYTAGHVTGGKNVEKGGGVFVEKGGELNMNGGIISGNTATWGGGIGNSGTVTMSGGQITNNTTKSIGGGVFNANSFMLKGDAAIVGNEAGWDGGGVYNSGDFVMENGKISGNTSGCDGGGVHIYGGYNVTKPEGGATFIMEDGEIADNVAKTGGVSIEFGEFVMNGGAIVRNKSNDSKDCNGVANYTGKDDAAAATINYNNVIICNYGKDGAVETRHEFDGGEATDEGAAGHTVNCIHGCGQPSDVMPHTYGAWVTVNAPQIGVAGERKHTCTACGHAETEPIDPLTDEDETLGDQAIPLAAGPITRAEFIDYLWRHEGEPASEGVCTFTDVTEEHEYFAALCWADENGVAEAYFGVEGHEDGTFEPDELVTVAAVREFLGNFETVFGAQAVAAAELATLTGADDEAVLNCDEVLAEFFGEEYAPAVDEAA